MSYILLHIFISLIIGVLGIQRKFGFWGYFFYSLLFTPFLGAILLFASSRTVPKNHEHPSG